jgi:hypothetical protein
MIRTPGMSSRCVLGLLVLLAVGCAGNGEDGSGLPDPRLVAWQDAWPAPDLRWDAGGDADVRDTAPDGQPEDVTGEHRDGGLEAEELEAGPDVPPPECEVDEDCPPTGKEPCLVSVCAWYEEVGIGLCVAEVGLECESSEPCLVAVCEPAVGCLDQPGNNGAPCDDLDLCTVKDQCSNGMCIGKAYGCDDSNPCTADVCDPDTGNCQHPAIGGPCDDKDICTVQDLCVAGGCSGVAISCDDSDPCTIDWCDSASGCVHESLDGCCLDAADCQVGSKCFTSQCVNMVCQLTPVACNDGSPCTTDSCEPTKGCVFAPVPGCCLADAQCDDGSVCTKDWCSNLACQHEEVVCSDGNACTTDSCEPTKGCVFAPVPGCCLADAQCDDGNACTQDWCSNLACQHKAVVCQDNDFCTTDGCEPKAGCTYKPIAGCCHTAAECPMQDLCSNMTCSPDHKCVAVPILCDDKDVCTKDSCNPKSGCLYSPIAGCCTANPQCDDKDPCTDDACLGNVCDHKPKLTPECCQPDCKNKECGPDGCGGFCADCVVGFCNEDFKCQTECIPDCKNKECGPDGCGTYCGLCPEPLMCDETGQCVPCAPKCGGKKCGDDGCGGSCGFCAVGEYCQSSVGTCVPACTCIGASCYQDGFESGTLSGWSFEGDAETLHNMGASDAPQGWYMAFVGSGLSELALGKVQKAFCPQPKHKWFGFKWKHYSAEFKEWCGSIYQDTFIVTLDNGKQSLEVLSMSIDDLCPKGEGGCTTCGKKYVGLEPADVVFDYEDVWMTPWSTAYISLPEGFTNSPVTVTFEVSDVGDQVYVTAVLFDAVQFL